MKRVTCAKVIKLAFLIVICSACAKEKNEKDFVKDIIKSNIKERIDKKFSVGTVAVFIENGKEEYFCYGHSDTDSKRRINEKSVFEIGSVSKTFTALLLADLVQRGKIKLEDPIDQYFPDSISIPDYYGRKITFADLATHTSGLPREPINFSPSNLDDPYQDHDVEKLYSGLKQYRLKRGANKYEYSNLGIELLGQSLALISGKSFEKMLQEVICNPLRMDQTGTTNNSPYLTTGHMGTIPVAHWNLNALNPAGGIRSSGSDLVKYVKTQMGQLNADLYSAMALTQQPRSVIWKNTKIGLIWNITYTNDDQIISHSGATGGYRTFIGFSKKTNKAIILLNNSGRQQDDLGIYYFDQSKEITAVKKPIYLSRHDLESNLGKYKLINKENAVLPNQEFEITIETNQLLIKGTGMPNFHFLPESQSSFFSKETEATIKFFKNQSGIVDKMVISHPGITLVAARFSQ
jgi:D-alanyl-D-alanine-carboxypeptidase/D-alanyl-D-alanine-endopeptidase